MDLERMTEETFHLCDEIEHVNPFVYPQAAGVVFRVEKWGGAFSLKGFACANISEVFEEIVSSAELKRNRIKYFETTSLEQGQLLACNLFNRHFSLYEDLMMPGDRWQLDLELGSMTIYYYNRSPSSIPLGPLGDKKAFVAALSQLDGVEVNGNNRFCKISFKEAALEIGLRELLLEGTACSGLEHFELFALRRRFWLMVEKELFCQNSLLH